MALENDVMKEIIKDPLGYLGFTENTSNELNVLSLQERLEARGGDLDQCDEQQRRLFTISLFRHCLNADIDCKDSLLHVAAMKSILDNPLEYLGIEPNPYVEKNADEEYTSLADRLASKLDELSTFTPDNKVIFAEELFVQCVNKKITADLNQQQLEAVRLTDKELYDALEQANHVKNAIDLCTDDRCKNPFAKLSKETSIDAFQQYNVLVCTIVEGKGQAIVNRLATTTAPRDASKLVMLAETLFRDTTIPKHLGEVFELRRNVTLLAAADKPENIARIFLKPAYFNEAICHKNSELLAGWLEPNIDAIAQKFAQCSDADFSKICKKLEQITPAAVDQNNPSPMRKICEQAIALRASTKDQSQDHRTSKAADEEAKQITPAAVNQGESSSCEQAVALRASAKDQSQDHETSKAVDNGEKAQQTRASTPRVGESRDTLFGKSAGASVPDAIVQIAVAPSDDTRKEADEDEEAGNEKTGSKGCCTIL